MELAVLGRAVTAEAHQLPDSIGNTASVCLKSDTVSNKVPGQLTPALRGSGIKHKACTLGSIPLSPRSSQNPCGMEVA